MIVNIVGSPCSGKSSLSCELFVILKKLHLNVEYVNEYVKTMIWESRFDEINDQYYVARGQYNIIKNVSKKVDFTICDSPLLLSLFYNEYNKNNMSNIEKTKEYILEKMDEFEQNSIYIFLERDNNIPYSNIGRIHSEEESKKIQKGIKKIMEKYNINYTTFNVYNDDISKLVKLII